MGGNPTSFLNYGERVRVEVVHGNGEMEGTPFAEFAVEPEIPPLQLDQMFRDRQPQPGAGGLACEMVAGSEELFK